MYLATYAQRLLCVFGLGMVLSACGGTTDETPTTPTYTEVYAQMKSACGSCHATGGVAAKKFVIDSNSATTYTSIKAANLITTADASPLIVVGKGGTYTPAGGGTATNHTKNLTDAMATSWGAWITAGAQQN